MSPRNTAEAVVNMIEKSNCHRIICSHAGLLDSVQQILQQKGRTLVVHQLPPLEDVFPTIRGQADVSVEPYPPATRKHEPDDNVIHLHSSGSTGFPKTITLTQKIMTMWLNNCTFVPLSRVDERPNHVRCSFYDAEPPEGCLLRINGPPDIPCYGRHPPIHHASGKCSDMDSIRTEVPCPSCRTYPPEYH